MSKPTMMQTLLNRPSQTYSFPVDKDYFSTKPNMLRVAAEAAASPLGATNPSLTKNTNAKASPVANASHDYLTSSSLPEDIHDAQSRTPRYFDSSPTAGSPSSSLSRRNAGHSPTPVRRRRSSANSRASGPRICEGGSGSDSDSSQDVFYTPNTSPRTSMASSVATVSFPVQSHAGQVHLSPSPGITMSLEAAALSVQAASSVSIQQSLPLLKATNFSSISILPSVSTSSLASTVSLDGHDSSLFSFSPSDETRVTTPVQSDEGHIDSSTENKRSTPARTLSEGLPVFRSPLDLSSIPVKATTTRPVARKLSAAGREQRPSSTYYTTEDWARDVRWLTPPLVLSTRHTMAGSTGKQRRRSNPQQWMDPPKLDHLNAQRTKKAKTMPKATSRMRMGMSTLLEEDEDLSASTGRSRSTRDGGSEYYGSPKSSALDQGESPRPRQGGCRRATSLDVPERNNNTDLGLNHQRSRSLVYAQSRSSATPSNNEWVLVPSSHFSDTPSLPSHGTPGYTSLTLPRAPPPPSASLGLGLGAGSTKARYAQVESLLRFDRSGMVDLTRSGIAQTTMATVEVVQGLSSTQANTSHFRSKGLRAVQGFLSSAKRAKSGVRSVAASGQSGSELCFTSYRAPPSQVPAEAVLVQVWAVAIDEVDRRLAGIPLEDESTPRHMDTRNGVEEGKGWPGRGRTFIQPARTGKAENKPQEVGFIPGRSFVGRVLEVGFDVREEVMRKGEWVVGLLDVKKCGALAEFIVVDRHRVQRVPHPAEDGTSPFQDLSNSKVSPEARSQRNALFRSTSTNSTRAPWRSTPNYERQASKTPTLTVGELALLPLLSIPAYRAVRTLDLANTRSFSSGEQLHQVQRRAIVLRGHDGAGAIAAQMLVQHGWRVSIHAPLPVFLATNPDAADVIPDRSRMEEVEDCAREWGVEEVIFDDGVLEDDTTLPAVRVLDRLHGDGDLFDAVLDTIGGKDIWIAAERLLQVASSTSGRSAGQFTTLVGDFPDRPIATAGDLFRAGLRSWRISTTGSQKRQHHGSMSEGSDVGHSASGTTGSSILHRHVASDDGHVNGIIRSPSRASRAGEGSRSKGKGKIGYAWVNVAQDVDWEGEDIRDTLSAVLRLALEQNIRPRAHNRIIAFENAPEAFAGGEGMNSVIRSGGAVVVKIVE